MLKPLSVQLYSLREFAAADFWKELKIISTGESNENQ